jgi:Trypsin-like peptidase domain
MAADIAIRPVIDRRHLYAAASITSTFFNRIDDTTLPSRPGTVFVIQGANNELYFVTNRHMVDYNFNLPASDKRHGAQLEGIQVRGHFQPDDMDQPTTTWSVNVRRPPFVTHDEVDIAVLEGEKIIVAGDNENADLQYEGGAERWQVNRFDAAQLANAAELDKMLPGETIHQTGFPGVGELTANRPLMVTGIVSSDPRYPAVFDETVLPGSVLCHAFSWGGMSGAPVIAHSYAIGRSALVGVNAGHIASRDVSGGVISHFARSDKLAEMLSQLGALTPTTNG